MTGKELASVLLLCAGQAVAQIPLNEVITAEAGFYSTLETAIEVASAMADEGFFVGEALFKNKGNCRIATVQLRLTRLKAFFKTSRGMLKVVEAVADGERVYVITLSDLKGIEEVRKGHTPQPT